MQNLDLKKIKEQSYSGGGSGRAPLRGAPTPQIKQIAKTIKRNPIYILLENVYDTFNIGGFFRLCDAIACQQLILVGRSSTPPDNKIKKSSVGTVHAVDWQYYPTTKSAIESIKKEHPKLYTVAVELDKQAVMYNQTDYPAPILLIFGNETNGVSKETLAMVDKIIQLPMYGVNGSLNVVVSAGIITYHILNTWQKQTSLKSVT